MSYKMKKNLANRKNYGSSRSTSNIKYIVIHYTANDGDHDEGNANYFKNNVVKASAHYFVDDDSVTQSVPDNYVAYSVGGRKYGDCSRTGGGKLYGTANNHNTISIEMCDTKRDGKVMATEATMANTAAFCKTLMNKYGIDINHVIRHFDVTGKHCPEYFMNSTAWANFKKRITGVNTGQTSIISDKSGSYRVKINTAVLNVRKGPGTDYGVATTVKKGDVYTIVADSNGWGKLKSGAGWIKLSYTIKV